MPGSARNRKNLSRTLPACRAVLASQPIGLVKGFLVWRHASSSCVRLQPPRPRGKYVLVALVLSLEIWKLALSFALWKGTLPPGLARSKSIRRSIPTPQEGSQIHLHQSAQIGAAESVEVLLKAGANVSEPSHAVPPFGATPLFRAALGGHVPVVKMLLEARADPNQLCEVFVGGVLGSSNKSIVARPIDWATGPAGPEVVKLLRAYGSLPSSQPKVLFDEMPPDAPASSLSSVADNKTWNVPKFVNMSIPMWCWLESDQEKWTQLADPHKAWVASTLKIDPLPSMAKRERSRYISVKGQPLLPEDAVNLHDEPGEELLEQMEKALASFFQTDEVILIPGGSSSRLTDLESSDWDYYFDVPGTVVTAEQRDKLLTHLCDKLSCSGKLSPRGIAIQLQVDDISLELVPPQCILFRLGECGVFAFSGIHQQIEEWCISSIVPFREWRGTCCHPWAQSSLRWFFGA